MMHAVGRTRRTCSAALAATAALLAVAVTMPAAALERPGETPAGGSAADDVRAIEPFSATSADGTVLRGHVYLPEADRPLATVLILSPYWSALSYGETDADHDQGMRDYYEPFLDAGFAVALVSMRGTGSSDGCFVFGDERDAEDAHAVVQTLAAQPWSNGSVGMFGASYDGWSQSLALTTAPPALKAVVPIASVIDQWSLLTRNGAPIHPAPVVGPVWTVRTSWASQPLEVDRVDCPRALRDWFAPAELAVSGDRTPWMDERDYRDAVFSSRVPMFVAQGILPWHEAHIAQVEGLWEARDPQTTRMLIGQWGHRVPPRDDYYDQVIAWFDHYLRGGPRTAHPGVVEYQDDTGAWHTTDQWPPSGERRRLHLGDGTLEHAEPSGTWTQTFASDDLDPGLSIGPRDLPPSTSACGPRQALYTSAPLEESVHLAGNVAMELEVTSTLPGGNLAAMLFHTPGDGTCPDLDAVEFARALTDLRHWRRTGQSQPFPVGETTTVPLVSQPFATQIPAGHRIVLAVAGGSTELLANRHKPVLTITSGDGVGFVDLPVVDRAVWDIKN